MTNEDLQKHKLALTEQYEKLRDDTNQLLGAIKFINTLLEKETDA